MAKLQPDGVSNTAVAVVFMVVDTLAVMLRLVAKRRTKHRFGSDDSGIVFALVLFFVWAGLVIHVPNADDASEVFKFVWIAEMWFFATITAVKITILTFYRSIFSTGRFGIVTYIISALCVMWFIAGLLVLIFGCNPIAANYVVTYPTKNHCVPFGFFTFLLELLNSLIDVSILAMPCVVIRRLHLSPQQKWQLTGVFLLGAFVLITCVLRMVYSFDPLEFYNVPSFPNRIVWSTAELGVAIVCACLPTYRPLLPKSFGFFKVKTWYFSFYRITGTDHGSASKPDRQAERSAEYINLEMGGGGKGGRGG
ncbi:MAG: hypothetical protein Q9181_007189 [Wetmoreana brouardii]